MLTKLEFTPPVTVKAPQYQTLQNSVQHESRCFMEKDRRTDMAGLMVAFHNIVKEPQKDIF